MMSSTPNHKRLLFVGNLCVDIVTVVKVFPEEDTDSRTAVQRWQRGGNPSNNCTVLTNMGVPCSLLATVGGKIHDPGYAFLMQDLRLHGINVEYCVLYEEHGCPMSVIIVSEETGSRTILHHRGTLPELELKDFEVLDLSVYKWIHFEARNVAENKKMIQAIDKWNDEHRDEKRIMVSVELEKHRPGFEGLIPLADIVFVSKDIAQECGFHNKIDVAKTLATKLKDGATVICPWGENGAAACTSSGDTVSVPAHHVVKVLDTLGAGDTFVATTIYALSEGRSLTTALQLGCYVAGEKCGSHGYDGLRKLRNILNVQI